MGHPVDDMIAAAGSLLQEQWRRGKNPQMPENDLNPNAQGLQFRIKLLEDRCDMLEKTLGQCVRWINDNSKRK